VPRTASEHLLHNQTANIFRLRLRAHEDIVVVDVPYHIGSVRHAKEQATRERLEVALPEPPQPLHDAQGARVTEIKPPPETNQKG
jgi:hypothetical protein